MLRHQNFLRLSLSVSTLGAALLGGCGPASEPTPATLSQGTELALPGQKGEVVTAEVTLPGLGRQTVTYEKIDGQAILDGDILLDLREGQTRSGLSVGRTASTARWPNGTIPYVIDPSLPDIGRVLSAISNWEAMTSLRFKARTTETDYVRFVPGSGCSSYVGRIGGEQVVNLALGTGQERHPRVGARRAEAVERPHDDLRGQEADASTPHPGCRAFSSGRA